MSHHLAMSLIKAVYPSSAVWEKNVVNVNNGGGIYWFIYLYVCVGLIHQIYISSSMPMTARGIFLSHDLSCYCYYFIDNTFHCTGNSLTSKALRVSCLQPVPRAGVTGPAAMTGFSVGSMDGDSGSYPYATNTLSTEFKSTIKKNTITSRGGR